jgi:hypothetical protein
MVKGLTARTATRRSGPKNLGVTTEINQLKRRSKLQSRRMRG